MFERLADDRWCDCLPESGSSRAGDLHTALFGAGVRLGTSSGHSARNGRSADRIQIVQLRLTVNSIALRGLWNSCECVAGSCCAVRAERPTACLCSTCFTPAADRWALTDALVDHPA